MGGPPSFGTADEMVRRRIGDQGTGLLFEGRAWTWDEVMVEAAARAALLSDLRDRLAPADRSLHVGLLSENTPEYLFLLAGAAMSGTVLVGLNPTRRGERLAADVRRTDCDLVLTESAGTAEGSADASLLEGLDAQRDLGLSPDSPGVVCTDTTTWAELVDAHRGATPHDGRAPAPEDLFLLIFTSGSTGDPKAVRMTQGRAARTSRRMPLQPTDIAYCAMPLFHGNALAAACFPAFATGATLALRRRFSAGNWLPEVRDTGATFFNTVGRALAHLLATEPTDADRDHRLAFVLAPETATADKEAFTARFGVPVFDGYGSSENAIILNPAPATKPGALGVGRDEDDVVVLDPDTGEECPPARFDDDGRLLNAAEATGELVGRNVAANFEGYYNDAAAESQRLRDGWYWSGDLVVRDVEGVFWFAGRTGDWLRVDSENFTAAPIERILGRFEGVTGVAVYPVPDVRTGDQVMAAIEVPSPGDFEPTALVEFMDAQSDLGPLWWPRYLRVVSALPVTGTYKVDKQPLRAERWHTDDPLWVRDPRSREFRRLGSGEVADLDEQLAAGGGVSATVAPTPR